MNRNGTLLLLFATLIAGLITWLNSYWLTYQDFQFSRKEKLIDYYLSDFTLLNTHESGEMRYKIQGRHLVHQQANGSSEIFKPILQARDNNGTLITMSANKAHQLEKHGDIKLLLNVTINKFSEIPKENFRLTTEELNYNPNQKLLTTTSQLLLETYNGSISGQGFQTKLEDKELRILSNVHIKFDTTSSNGEEH